MIEDYSVLLSEHIAIPAGMYEITRTKTRRPVLKYEIEYKTPMGSMSRELWKERAMEEIKLQGEEELLEKIKLYCRINCAWLRKESEVEEYAMECLCARAYKYWKDFEDESYGKQVH